MKLNRKKLRERRRVRKLVDQMLRARSIPCGKYFLTCCYPWWTINVEGPRGLLRAVEQTASLHAAREFAEQRQSQEATV
jgi:hypothetical protein